MDDLICFFLEKSNYCLCSVTQIPIVPATLLLHCKTIGSYDGSWHEIDYAIGETISYLSIIDARQETSVDYLDSLWNCSGIPLALY